MRLTIGRKLGLGFGLALAILAFSGVVTLIELRNIESHLARITNDASPLSAAAYEMEVALLRIGFNLLGYVNDHDTDSLKRIEKAGADFRDSHDRFQGLIDLTENTTEAALAESVTRGSTEFMSLADDVVRLEAGLSKDLQTLTASFSTMEDILHEKVQGSIQPNDPQAYAKMQASMGMEIDLTRVAKHLGSFLRTSETDYAEQVRTNLEHFDHLLGVYNGLNLTAPESYHAEELLRLFNDSRGLALHIVEDEQQIMDDLARCSELRREIQGTMVDELLAKTGRRLQEAEESAQASASAAVSLIIGLGVIGLSAGCIGAVIITRGITKPLRTVVSRVDEIAGATGDLTASVDVTSTDEVGDLAKSFNRLLLGLRSMVTRVVNGAQGVSASSQQLTAAAQQTNAAVQQVSSAVQQLSQGAQSQALRVEEGNKAMQQLGTSISSTAESVEHAATASAQASESAQKGAARVMEAIAAMNKIDASAALASEAVMTLGKRAQQMVRIVDVITTLADQTNLLSLNAAIEAARAGEAGSGFAVVAEEVRKLAESSAGYASDIRALINETTGETGTAMKNMEITSSEVAVGKAAVSTAGGALEEISQASDNVAVMLQRISGATKQISAASGQLVKLIEDIASVAEEASASTQQAGASTEQMLATMQEMAASAQSLAEMGMDLNELVAEFRIGESDKSAKADVGPRRSGARRAVQPLARRLAAARVMMQHENSSGHESEAVRAAVGGRQADRED